MEYEFKLQPKYYDFILKGTKRIEIRLNDAKRQLIKTGDIIKFLKEPELKEFFKVRVIDLLKYKTFKDMFEDYDISILGEIKLLISDVNNSLNIFFIFDIIIISKWFRFP